MFFEVVIVFKKSELKKSSFRNELIIKIIKFDFYNRAINNLFYIFKNKHN